MKHISEFLFILTLNLLSIVYFYNIDYAHGQTNGTTTQTLIQQNPGIIKLQPPIDAQTGAIIELPGTVVAIKDPQTGQLITKEVKLVPPEVTGPSLSTTTIQEPLLDPNLGLLTTVPPYSVVGNPNAAFGPVYVTKSITTLNPDISEILNNPSEVIDWDQTESVIAVKAELDESGLECNEEDCFEKKINNMTILVETFMGNNDGLLTQFIPSKLYKFVHIPSEKWEGPAIFMDVKLVYLDGTSNRPFVEVTNYTKSSMCNTYIELGKLYKCNITIK